MDAVKLLRCESQSEKSIQTVYRKGQVKGHGQSEPEETGKVYLKLIWESRFEAKVKDTGFVIMLGNLQQEYDLLTFTS